MRRLVVAFVGDERVGAELYSAWLADRADDQDVAALLRAAADRVESLGVDRTVAETAEARGRGGK